MKKKPEIVLLAISLFFVFNQKALAQKESTFENYGNTLNLGLGLGYYGYSNNLIPEVNANYEFNTARNFTLAPFAGLYSYSNSYYYGDPVTPYRYYNYYETIVPLGVKGTYYFNQLLKANPRWDFYLAASAGFDIISSRWDTGYMGDRNYFHGANPLFMDLHAGAEFHASKRIGYFLDLSSGVSTIGMAIHRK